MGSTVIQPGQKSFIQFETQMHPGMDGPHLFSIAVQSNDGEQAEQEVTWKALFGN